MFGFLNLNAQTYNYSYADPCTGNVKTIVVPINGNITVSYYGSIGSFSQNDFTNGTFDAWTNNIFSQYGTNSPCSEIVGLGTTVNVTQNTALNVIGILNSLSTISDLAGGSTNILGGSVSSINNTGGNNNSKNNKKGNNSQNGSGGNTTNTNNSTTTNTNNIHPTLPNTITTTSTTNTTTHKLKIVIDTVCFQLPNNKDICFIWEQFLNNLPNNKNNFKYEIILLQRIKQSGNPIYQFNPSLQIE